MKTLNEIEDEIEKLKEQMICQEIGHDSYYSSPLYHKNLLRLQALEQEEQVLKGKMAPISISFDGLSIKKQHLLHDIAESHGFWCADYCRELKETDLIQASVLEPICNLKTEYLKNKNPRLHTDEILIALTISALNSDVARKAKEQLVNLRGSDAHFTVILSAEDEKVLKKLGINVSYEPKHENGRLYHK